MKNLFKRKKKLFTTLLFHGIALYAASKGIPISPEQVEGAAATVFTAKAAGTLVPLATAAVVQYQYLKSQGAIDKQLAKNSNY